MVDTNENLEEVSVLLTKQRDLTGEIEKLVASISKTSIPNRTEVHKLEKQHQLDQLWQTFVQQHHRLQEELPADHPYMKGNLETVTKTTVSKGNSKLQSWNQDGIETPTPGTSGDQLFNPPISSAPPLTNTNATAFQTAPQTPTTSYVGPQIPMPGTSYGQGLFWPPPTQPIQPTYVPYANMNIMGPPPPKLAPIVIPTFQGDWKNWATFIGLFESLVDTNHQLYPIQKMQYLLNYLTGEALDCLRHIPLHNDNYTLALKTLKSRYDNPRRLCLEFVANILDLPKMNNRSADDLHHILTTLSLSLHGLDKQNYNTSTWAPIVVTCVTRKLDEESRLKFEESLQDSRQVPSIETLTSFLERRYQYLSTERVQLTPPIRKALAMTSISTKSSFCSYCKKSTHNIRQCRRFTQLSTRERADVARTKRLCLNCLGNHPGNCQSRMTCKMCNGRHHSLLHIESKSQCTNLALDDKYTKGSNTLLATALIKVRNFCGKYETLRALIDPGSQECFITLDAATSLSIPMISTNIEVSGIGGTTAGKITKRTDLTIGSHFPSLQQFHVSALVLPKLTTNISGPAINQSIINQLPRNVILADPSFNTPGQIDILLGADVFALILKDGIKKFNQNQLLMQNTEFGWIISGRILETTSTSQALTTFAQHDQQMKNIWEIEDDPQNLEFNTGIDRIHNKTTTRDENGRYTVCPPRKKDSQHLTVHIHTYPTTQQTSPSWFQISKKNIRNLLLRWHKPKRRAERPSGVLDHT